MRHVGRVPNRQIPQVSVCVCVCVGVCVGVWWEGVCVWWGGGYCTCTCIIMYNNVGPCMHACMCQWDDLYNN